ncbi:MAG TPA: NAD-dependent epimerase/dehydratase family protein [Kineosporiaceae bacterium]|nr:NAD-dependent epimerase/dehydratase family protein [Kineosporiaceae bacterium]
MESSRHVVVGAGAVGSAVATLLSRQGHRVVVVTRSGSGPAEPGIERVAADAVDAEHLASLCTGAHALYNCANPPYHRWATDWPPIAAALLEAARRSGAVLATVSNLYGYGPVGGPMTEQTPLAATGTKGRVRARMWLDALAEHEAGRARVTEVRGSDYLGPGSQSQLGDQVVPRLLAGRAASILGEPDVPHTWTYTGDVARMLVTAAADERAWGRAWHVPSHPARTARDVVAMLCELAGVPPVPVRRIPAVLVRAGGLVVPLLRELPEVMHQHVRPWVMDSSAAGQTFGLQPTPWPELLRAHLDGYRGTTGRAATR